MNTQHFDVLVIGAGRSGIGAACQVGAAHPNTTIATQTSEINTLKKGRNKMNQFEGKVVVSPEPAPGSAEHLRSTSRSEAQDSRSPTSTPKD